MFLVSIVNVYTDVVEQYVATSVSIEPCAFLHRPDCNDVHIFRGGVDASIIVVTNEPVRILSTRYLDNV